jgi:hypothetical protein
MQFINVRIYLYNRIIALTNYWICQIYLIGAPSFILIKTYHSERSFIYCVFHI